jgi:hypothetical protein
MTEINSQRHHVAQKNQTNSSILKSKERKHEKTSPVFRIKPENKANKAIIKYVGYLKEEEKLGDETVELDKPLHPESASFGKHAIPIKQIGEYDMVGRLYRCNIVGTHIVISCRYPVMYLNIEYERPMVSGSLLQLFFSIDMNPEEKKIVKEHKKYVNLRFTGKWIRHIDCDDELTQHYEKLLLDMLEADAINNFYNSNNEEIINLKKTLTDDQIANWVDSYVETERKFYDSIMQEQQMEFKSITHLRDEFVALCISEKFHKFLQLAMKARNIHRRKNYGLDENSIDYVIPKNVTKLDDIKNMMIANDELILDDDVVA